ncbi:TetR/AcrR family transcriptional regulator [Actinocorallia herbida]|nr:helix-turn-helix domain-containing protein [Actinocorallia herbida]
MTTSDRPDADRPAQEHRETPLRRDAERNRERIIDAARSAFASDGIEISMASVARAAGVGIATLFRRFPTREDLIDAVFADTMHGYVEAVETALADPDPWHGFTGYVETVSAMQAADRGFAELLTMTFPTATLMETERHRAYTGFLTLVERAKTTGRLREDFVSQDLVLLLMANAGVIAATRTAAPDSWRRLIGYLLQAFAAPPTAPLPPAPDPEDLARAMLGLNCASRGQEPPANGVQTVAHPAK